MLKDPRRLYAPGRLYHIIVRKPFRYICICIYICVILGKEVSENNKLKF